MANHDSVPGQSKEFPLIPASDLGFEDSHNPVMARCQNLGSEQMLDLDLGHAAAQENQALVLSQRHGDEIISQTAHEQKKLEENGVKVDRDGEPDAGQDDAYSKNLALTTQTHEMNFSEDLHNLELAVIKNSDCNEKSEFSLDQNLEMSNLAVSDMIAEQSQDLVLFTPPVLQSRSSVPALDQKLCVGQQFSDVHSCRRAVRDAAIVLRFEIQTIKSDKNRFTAKCASEGCPWRIHAAKLPGLPTFTIRTIHEPHTCAGITHLGHQQASAQWVAESVEQRLMANPNCKPKEILEEIHRVHGITLSYKQAWRGKERIMASVRGSYEQDFRLLPQYCDQIKRSNPGSIAVVYVNPYDNCFQRLFISFQASIFGFLNACRPLIGLDRVPLKGKYLGTMLLATSFDGDGGLYPLAFGVFNKETDDNWMWFLSELRGLLESNAEYTPRLTILSDRQKGIVDGVDVNFPTAFHGFCMSHLTESFQKEFNNAVLVNIFREAAGSLTGIEFEAKLIEIENLSQEAAAWIRRVPPQLWATAYFDGTRLGHLTANVVESLNALITEASGLPIIQMMEGIRRKLMEWFNERREASMQWSGILVPFAERHVSDAINHAHSYQVLRANEAQFQVIGHSGQHVVDIRTRRCSCHGWQVCGLPCAHAVSALLSCRQHVHRFTETYFTVANYRKAYSETIHPIPDRTSWNLEQDDANNGGALIINPPKSLIPPGRPRRKRAHVQDSGGTKRRVHCSRCNQEGHFRTTCTAPI
ncbi:hypothetical protein L6164_010020 [Bauhinia variegata]|uniref:Uncharacterized protein n=1 Tax=Bauhinia variegata TaxID=167791 RepID=A0ACB9PLW4_BAUVA|nr:hypothetical protein L6164_010020 [Bauhinia variegata]